MNDEDKEQQELYTMEEIYSDLLHRIAYGKSANGIADVTLCKAADRLASLPTDSKIIVLNALTDALRVKEQP